MSILAAVAVLVMAGGAQALTLKANEDVSDGVLSGTNSAGAAENIRTNALNPTLFWWADTNGDNTAGDPASAGLNLGAYNLTRQNDYSVGFTLNLNDGIQDRAITWPGVAGGKITTQRDTNGRPAAPIAIRGATDIACEGFYTYGASSAGGGDVTVTQSGNFTASNIWTYGWYNGSRAGAVSCTGGGTTAGTFTINGQIDCSDHAYAGSPLTISGYRAVSIGSGGIENYNTGASDGNTLSITNIGAGGVTVVGPINHYTRGANQSSYTHPNNVTISTTGNIQLNTVSTYQWHSGEYTYTDSGTIRLTAGGSIVATGTLATYQLADYDAQSRNSGALVVTADGTVQLAGIDTHRLRNQSNRYAGDVNVTAGGDISIRGTINLYSPNGGDRRGDLSLTNNLRGTITLNALDMTNLNIASFNSGVGWSQITNTLANFVTNYTSGSGTWVAPYVTTQTQLRTPAGQRIYYTYAAGLTNDYLGGYTYQVRNLQNTGAGGLLMVRVAGAPEIYNVGATNVAASSADMVANLTAGDATVTVTCYWGTNDAGSVAGNWNNTNSFAVSSPGYVTNSVTGLEGGRTYFFRYFASNTAASVWASDTLNLSTVGLPSVDNGAGPASITQTSALLQGHKLSGDASCQVWIYWGTADGGTTKGAWNRGSVYIGTPGIDPYSTAVSGLPANQVCWYRNYITNSVGDTWSATSATFTTQPPTMVIGDIGLPEGPQGTTNPAVFTVTLSATSAVPVSVDFATANGSALTSDSDYVATNGTLTIPPNAWSGTIAVPVIGDNKSEPDENFVLNLSNPVYAITNNNRGTCTITNDDFSIYVRGDGAGSDANDGTSWATALATLTNAVARAPTASPVRSDVVTISQVWQLSTPIRFYVQASAPGQAYDVVARLNGPLDLDFEGGWENVTVAPTQTGMSVIKDLDGTINESGISLTGANHYQWRRLMVNRFVFTNVTRGVEIDLGTGNSDKCDALLIVSNMTVDALTDGIYVRYMHTYSTAGAGGLARLTAGNVAISAGQGGAGHGVFISGSWQGSSITASGTNAATGEPRVSTITSANGDGVHFTAYNKEARDASFANTVIYNCATNGVNLDAAIQTAGGQNPGVLSNVVRAAFTHCTIAGNGADGVHTLSSLPTPSWAAPTNCIFANNSGHGINLDGGTGAVACVENYNVFFNDDIWTNGVAQALSGTTVAADPLFYGQRSKPAPWYQLASSSSPAYHSGNDGRNRGAYQGNRIPGGTIILVR
jgi:hypothetical protein